MPSSGAYIPLDAEATSVRNGRRLKKALLIGGTCMLVGAALCMAILLPGKSSGVDNAQNSYSEQQRRIESVRKDVLASIESEEGDTDADAAVLMCGRFPAHDASDTVHDSKVKWKEQVLTAWSDFKRNSIQKIKDEIKEFNLLENDLKNFAKNFKKQLLLNIISDKLGRKKRSLEEGVPSKDAVPVTLPADGKISKSTALSPTTPTIPPTTPPSTTPSTTPPTTPSTKPPTTPPTTPPSTTPSTAPTTSPTTPATTPSIAATTTPSTTPSTAATTTPPTTPSTTPSTAATTTTAPEDSTGFGDRLRQRLLDLLEERSNKTDKGSIASPSLADRLAERLRKKLLGEDVVENESDTEEEAVFVASYQQACDSVAPTAPDIMELDEEEHDFSDALCTLNEAVVSHQDSDSEESVEDEDDHSQQGSRLGQIINKLVQRGIISSADKATSIGELVQFFKHLNGDHDTGSKNNRVFDHLDKLSDTIEKIEDSKFIPPQVLQHIEELIAFINKLQKNGLLPSKVTKYLNEFSQKLEKIKKNGFIPRKVSDYLDEQSEKLINLKKNGFLSRSVAKSLDELSGKKKKVPTATLR